MQGAITMINQIDGINDDDTYCHVQIRFQTPSGEKLLFCNVNNKEDIPGWGVIPETRNNPDLRKRLRLKKPFIINIEYIPWNYSVARAVGTRFSSHTNFYSFISILTTLVIYYMTFRLHRSFRRIKHLLAEGLFTTGQVLIPEGLLRNPFYFIVCFIDRHSVRRKGSCIVMSELTYTVYKWANDGQSVGLLYLPDLNKVIITDLWLDMYE